MILESKNFVYNFSIFNSDSLDAGQLSVIDFDSFSITVVWGAVEGTFDDYIIQFEPPTGNPIYNRVERTQSRETTVTSLIPGQLQTISLILIDQVDPISVIQQRTGNSSSSFRFFCFQS